MRESSQTPTLRTIFLAGAGGAVGRRLGPLLVGGGFRVVGTTRSATTAKALQALSIEPVQIDAFDAAGLETAIRWARPEIVIHQLTDLPKVFDPELMPAARERTARLREEGTRNLMRAAAAAGVRRAIVQSICFAYGQGSTPHLESDPIASPSIIALESAALHTAGVDGVVLRYGRLWGPGTWAERSEGLVAPLHVDAAAHAAFLAIDAGAGVYNIADDDRAVSTARARRELGFKPLFRAS
jgi:nucleoside-diphosphate-sugar epimerase